MLYIITYVFITTLHVSVLSRNYCKWYTRDTYELLSDLLSWLIDWFVYLYSNNVHEKMWQQYLANNMLSNLEVWDDEKGDGWYLFTKLMVMNIKSHRDPCSRINPATFLCVPVLS